MKIVVVRGDSLRHSALSAQLQNEGFSVFDFIIPKATSLSDATSAPLERAHFLARDQVESDFFRFLPSRPKGYQFSPQSINSPQAVESALALQPDYVVTFGCPILQKVWLNGFANKIIGIHLGLSPYYRGSGTNYWPLVNDEPAAVGVTFMNLDEGIDTGAVIHQRRATYVLGDSIHSANNRLISHTFDDLARLIRSRVNLENSVSIDPKAGNYFKSSDFSTDSLERLYSNFRDGMIERYLEKQSHFDDSIPLIQELTFVS